MLNRLLVIGWILILGIFTGGTGVVPVFAAPPIVGSVDTPGYAQDVHVAGSYAYVNDGSGGLQIINVSEPKNPTIAGSFDELGSPEDVYVSGSYAYVTDYLWGQQGLKIIDITNPDSPTLTKILSCQVCFQM